MKHITINVGQCVIILFTEPIEMAAHKAPIGIVKWVGEEVRVPIKLGSKVSILPYSGSLFVRSAEEHYRVVLDGEVIEEIIDEER